MSLFGNLGLIYAFTRAHIPADTAASPEPGDREGLLNGPPPIGEEASNTAQLNALRAAANTDNWCTNCEIHRTYIAGGLCPGCAEDAKKAQRGDAA